MVADKPDITEVLPKFLAFCDGCAVVAHNAGFDCGFIRYNAAQLELKFDNRIIDTLQLSRELFPDEKKHSLDVVSKRLGVSLENHHRAVDDATATAEIFLKFAEIVHSADDDSNVNIDTKPELLKGQKYHIIILAKNYVGLKNLYKLISKSNLDYFYKRPIMPRSVIEKHRDGLIIGSACEAGELYRAIVDKKPDEQLLDIASFYDYLEIQPLGNNEFMIRNETVSGIEDLELINREIVELGDSMGKMTVGTCDVHFTDPADSIYRCVLMTGQDYDDAANQAPLYFRTTEEMLAEFKYLGGSKAKEIVITNPNKIADMTEEIIPIPEETCAPEMPGSVEEIQKLS